MTHFDIFSIDKHYSIEEAQDLLHLLEGEWYPQGIDTKPLKFNLDSPDASHFICERVNKTRHDILLYHKKNSSIIIEIHIAHPTEIILNIKNVNALGTSPKMTFIKK